MRKIAQRAMGGPLVRAWNSWLDSMNDKQKTKRLLQQARHYCPYEQNHIVSKHIRTETYHFRTRKILYPNAKNIIPEQ